MSLDIGKIIQIYQGCLTLLKAKQNLSIDSHELNALLQQPQINRMQYQNLCVQFIEDGILRVLKAWEKKFSLYNIRKDEHRFSYSQLHYQAESLKNNTQLVTREDQLIAQIQKMMAQWRQNMDPTQYYNSKYRRTFKQQMQQKLQNLKFYINKNINTNSPDFTRKAQSELRDNIIDAYYKETKIDRVLIDTIISIHDQIAQLLAQLDDLTIQKYYNKDIMTQSSNFQRDIREILHRPSRPSDRRLRAYAQSLSQTINKCYLYWTTLRKSLDHLILLINEVFKVLAKIKSGVEQKQDIINRLLKDVPQQIASIFRVSIIYHIIKSFNSSFQASQMYKLIKIDLLTQEIKQLKQESQLQKIKMTAQTIQIKQFKKLMQDTKISIISPSLTKNSLKNNQNVRVKIIIAEKTIVHMVIQNFKQFLQQCYNLTKKIRKTFSQQCRFQQLEPQRLNEQVSILIINDLDDICMKEHNTTMVSQKPRSIYQDSKKSQFDNKRAENLHKIEKIEKFINSIELFQSKTVSQEEKFYSCALGPKILLHGKLYLLPDGIFFESHFNKKNLLFGKTKMFIPKSQILQIDMKSTLIIFPDAVIVKTEHGLVSFHALGQRKVISDAIKQTYMGNMSNQGQGNGNGGGVVMNFKPFDQSKKPTEDVIKSKSNNLQTILYQTTLKGSRLQNIFKRYFSDEKFNYNGKQYQSFKSYAMTLIDAKNPKSTALTPPPPVYFNLKSEKDPEIPYPTISNRQHNYGKDLPKIPFLSKGGEGQCSEKQTYTWMGPDALVIDVISTVKGFSLTQNMEVLIKYVMKQLPDGVKVTVSSQVKFSKESSSNGFVKGPTLSNIKQSMVKILQTIQKCEKSSMNGTNRGQNKQEPALSTAATVNETTLGSNKQINLSKQQLIYIAIGFVIFYLLTIILVRIF